MEYRRAVVSFVDVLGFRDLIEKEAPAGIEKILKRLVSTSQPHPFTVAGDQMGFVNFSDSIIRVAPITDDSSAAVVQALCGEIGDLAVSQSLVAQRGVFLRGGITVGLIACGEGLVFGPAMNRAYDLENKVAKVPRIILDPAIRSISAEVNEVLDGRYDEDEGTAEHFYLSNYLQRGEDGLYFIDYIRGLVVEDHQPEEALHLFKRHKEAILRAVDGVGQDVIPKYRWLAEYHDACLDVIDPEVFRHFHRTREEFLCSPHLE